MESIMESSSESVSSLAERIVGIYAYNTAITQQDIIDAAKVIEYMNFMSLKEKHDTIALVLSDIINYPWSSFAFIKLHRLKILDLIFPQLSALDACYYGNFSLFSHTMRVLNEVERGQSSVAVMKYAAIFHDIGKPDTHRESGGKPSFYGHEHRGAEIAWQFLTTYDLLSNEDLNIVYEIILAHMKPESLVNANEAGIQRFVQRYPESYDKIILFSIYDKLATIRNIERCSGLKSVLERAKKYASV